MKTAIRPAESSLDMYLGLGYLRVSSARQMRTAIDIDKDGNSFATQNTAIYGKSDELNTRIEKVFHDDGVSGQSIEKRKDFQAMLKLIDDNPGKYKYVLIYARSRAFRHLFEAFLVEHELNKRGVELVSATENFGEDEDTALMGKVLTDMVNHVQVRKQGKDIARQLLTKARAGGTVQRAPVGYLNVPVLVDEFPVNTVVIDENRAPLVRQAFELYATGDYSVTRLQAVLADQGLTTRPTKRNGRQPISENNLSAMLKNPYYISFIVFKGTLYPGRHEPLISAELFQRVQDVLAERAKKGTRDRILRHYLKGLLFCQRCRQNGVTSRLIYTESHNRHGAIYPYYLCRGRQDGICDLPYLAVEDVEDWISQHIIDLALSESFIADIRSYARLAITDETSLIRETKTNLESQIAKLDVEEERLLDLATDGSLQSAKLKERLRSVQLRRATVNERLASNNSTIGTSTETLEAYLDLLTSPHEMYRNAPNGVRHQLLETFYSRIWLDDLTVSGKLTSPVQALHDAATRDDFVGRQKQRDSISKDEAPSLDTRIDLLDIDQDLLVNKSSKPILVGPLGLEPRTKGL